jgi:hypothetical protein
MPLCIGDLGICFNRGGIWPLYCLGGSQGGSQGGGSNGAKFDVHPLSFKLLTACLSDVVNFCSRCAYRMCSREWRTSESTMHSCAICWRMSRSEHLPESFWTALWQPTSCASGELSA